LVKKIKFEILPREMVEELENVFDYINPYMPKYSMVYWFDSDFITKIKVIMVSHYLLEREDRNRKRKYGYSVLEQKEVDMLLETLNSCLIKQIEIETTNKLNYKIPFPTFLK
jgi:hypothetical protein